MKLLSPNRSTPRPLSGNRQVTVRDRLALRFVHEAGFARTDHLCVLLGASPEVVRRRVRVLRDLRLLNVHVEAMHAPSWVSCAPGARAVLAQTFGIDEDAVPCPRALPPSERLVHHELVVFLHAAVAAACARSRPEAALAWEYERQLRARLGVGSSGTQVPDAVAVLTLAGGMAWAVAVEADTGSEAPRIVVAKVDQYAAARRAGIAIQGVRDWEVAFLVPTERRRNRLALALGDAGLSLPWVHLGIRGEVSDRTVLTPAWRHVHVDDTAGQVRLQPGSPFRGVLSARVVPQNMREAR